MPEQEKKLIEKYSNWMRALITIGVLLLFIVFTNELSETNFFSRKYLWYLLGGGGACFVGAAVIFLLRHRRSKKTKIDQDKKREEIINRLPLEFREQYMAEESGLKNMARWFMFAGIIGVLMGTVMLIVVACMWNMSLLSGILVLFGAFPLIYLGNSYNDKRVELNETWDRMLGMIQSGEVSVDDSIGQLNAVLRQEEQKEQVQQAQSPQLHVNNLTAEEAQMLELLLKKAQNQNRNKNQ